MEIVKFIGFSWIISTTLFVALLLLELFMFFKKEVNFKEVDFFKMIFKNAKSLLGLVIVCILFCILFKTAFCLAVELWYF